MSDISACPACSVAPLAQEAVARKTADLHPQQKITLALPSIHCAACISGVERLLAHHPEVVEARVNLTLKRVTVTATDQVDAVELAQFLTNKGFEAFELDQTHLNETATEKAGRALLMRLAVAAFAMMNVMLLSIAVWSGAEGVTRDMFHWISALIVLPATAFSAQPFFVSAWSALRAGRLNMDVPISLAILLALVTSIWETVLSGEHAYFDAAIALTAFLLAGRYLDHRTRAIARSAAEELTALEVPRAQVIRQGEVKTVPVSEVSVGEIVKVNAGGRLPVDGVIVEGISEIDRSLITGETRPELADVGSQVSAGEINLSGPIQVRATAVGQETSLARIAELVSIAESGRSNYTSIADKAASLYAPGVHILSALAFVGWYLYSEDLRVALNIASAVLIITCPCALGLAVPAVTTAASGRLFKKGMLIKSGTALERISEVDTVVFDKTGTLTTGHMKLVEMPLVSDEALSIVNALAEVSSHPLSVALSDALQSTTAADEVTHVQEIPGYGVQGEWQGQSLRLGRPEWICDRAVANTSVAFAIDGQSPVIFEFEDNVREGAKDLMSALLRDGYDIHLLSGDAQAPVERVAQELGISQFAYGMHPEDKAAFIDQLRSSGRKVLMVGDGLNDTAALAGAHASISPATALEAARVASDIVFLGQDISPISDVIQTSKQAQRRITENFSIATIYNVIAVPIAIIGLATPLIAALAMSLSSITVSLNALRVR